MAAPAVDSAEYPTPTELLAQLLSEYRYAYNSIGVPVNVAKGTEPYIRLQTVANRLSIAIQNNKLALADISPLDAAGDALEELCGVYGVSRRAAVSAAGLVRITTVPITVLVTIPSGFQCTAPNGMQYQTTGAVTVGNNALVEVQAVTAGEGSNQDQDTVLTWDSAAIGQLGQNCTVASGDIDGGAAEDDDETLRQRLIRRLSFPQVGGNTSQVISFAEDASAGVQAAFVYPAVRGPGSYDVALVAEATDDDNNRDLNTVTVGQVASAILGNMPGNADLNCTTVVATPVDVIMNMSLPLPINAGGAGGGWRDAVPWPSSASTEDTPPVFPRITAYLNGTFTVNVLLADIPVQNRRFAVWHPTEFRMYEFTIASAVAGAPGAYTFTTSGDSHAWIGPLITAGDYLLISAGAVSIKDYGVEYNAGIRLLGPGEKTANVDILPRGRRNPPPDVSWPTDLNTRLTNAIYNAHAEVTNLSYVYNRLANGGATVTTPATPATTSDAPRIFTLHSVAFVHQR